MPTGLGGKPTGNAALTGQPTQSATGAMPPTTSAPTPPPNATLDELLAWADKQAAASRANTDATNIANRPNEYTPWGSSEWSRDANGGWTNRTQLTPEAQQALDSQMQLGAQRSGLAGSLYGQMASQYGQPMDYSKLMGLGSGEDARSRAENAIYGQATSRLDPQWNQRGDQLATQLMNQGLDPNSKAYQNAMGDFSRQRNDAYQGAMNNAITQGGQEASRTFGMDLSGRQQGLAEMLQQHNQPLNDVNALLGGQQVGMPQMPGFMGAGTSQTPDYLGAKQAQDEYNLGMQQMKNSQDSDMWTSIGNMFGSVAKFGAPFFIPTTPTPTKRG